jgi:anti-sigma28 factor (negative regulator of flagellin synthesis)
MRVNDPNNNPAANVASQTSASNSAASNAGQVGKTAQLDPIRVSSGAGGAAGASKTDEVQLSALSRQINELQSGSAERDAYLEGLRLEVASGQYEPDAAATSKKLVDDLLRGE